MRTDSTRHAFSGAAPYIWNTLPADVGLCDSVAAFKRNLNTFLHINQPSLCTAASASVSATGAKQIIIAIMTITVIGQELSLVLLVILPAWLGPVPSNPQKARCMCCNVRLMAKFSVLMQHARTVKHVRNQRNALAMTNPKRTADG